ncbi:MAG TPA: hypothetical protein VKB09_14065 [Thermomicrobiales bacterium]|nr:hypothetical protein [Thermomicrobiales bacterium]
MVISDPALQLIEDTRSRFRRRLGDLCRFRRDGGRYQYAPSEATIPVVASRPVEAGSMIEPAVRQATEPAELPSPVSKRFEAQAREIVLTAEERRARAIALRGLCQSRAHRFEAARASFVEATTMDPGLDLAKLPDFWRLPQGAHQAAIAAYEQVGRTRDAAALTASVRSTFKPRLFRPRQLSARPVPEA